MSGVVTYVSTYPATLEEEMRLLENEPLVRAMQGDGPDIQVSVTLDRDPTTKSGFKWSSRTGPPVLVDSGTICTAEIVTRTERPINLVFPAVKRTLGID
jgi:HlyD family secretion protein